MLLNLIRSVFVLLIIAAFYADGLCKELNINEILQRADTARGNLEGVEWNLDIHSIEKGREQNRKIEVKAKHFDFIATLTSPARVRGQKLLMMDHNMWFGKPGLRKPVPISPRQKLIGSAAYGDIAATNYSGDYKATLINTEKVDDQWCYVFDLEALHKRTTYDRIKYWISKERNVGVKAEYYSVSDKIIKTARFEYDNLITIDGQPQVFISRMIIEDALVKENITTMTFSKPRFVHVPDAAFDLNLLIMR